MPYTDGKHSLAKLQVSISEIKQYFHQDIYGRQPLAVACSCSVGRLAVARRGGGVHHGDGDGQAVVQEKGAALAAQPAWEKHTEEQASIMAWCAACPAVLAQSHGEQRQPQELQDLRKRRQEQGRWQQHWVQHRRWQRQGLRGPERGAEVQDVGDGEARVEGVGGVGGVECRECRECRNALTLLDTVRTSPLSRWLDTRWTLVSECRAECRSSVD